MSRRLRLYTLALLLLSQAMDATAQLRVADTDIKLQGITLHPSANAAQWIDSANAVAKAGDIKQAIIQFAQLPTTVQRIALGNAGITLLDYLPANSFIGILRFPISKAAVANLRGIIAMQPVWKVDGRVARQGNAAQKVLVSFVPGTAKADVEALIKIYKGEIKDKRFEAQGRYEISLPASNVLLLAAEAAIRYVGAPAEDKTLNYDQRDASGAMHLQAPVSEGGYGLEGNGMTIGIGDNSSGIFHTDTRDRVINFYPDPPQDHGVHTSGTAAGAGILDTRARGMAPKAQILGHEFNLVWAQTESMRQTYNMTLTNNSYAAVVGDCDFAGTYDQYAQMLDEQAQLYPDVLHVFAVGNDGNKQCLNFPQGYGTVAGGYQPAKNIVTVGSEIKTLIEHTGSAKGPVKDGRLKPDIMAFGHQIYSGFLFDTYTPLNGTSMAAPGVTGGLTLLSERYKQIHNSNAPGNILKALLLNGAMDLGNAGPDYKYGFGLMNLNRSINMLDAGQYIVSNVSQNNSNTHLVNVPPNTAVLKVMLYWHDPAASPMAAAALVNNLDLKLSEPNVTQHLPLILNPNPANVGDVATEGIDNLNNTEQITISNPQAGNYNVTVTGTQIPAGSQEYVLAYDFIETGVRLNNPVQGAAMAAGDSVNIYWEASPGTADFKLEYTIDGGGVWTVIDGNIPSDQRMRRWYLPSGIGSAQCMVRISRNGTGQTASSGLFTISPVPALQLSSTQCPGYIAMEWGAILNASAYIVMRKTGADMTPVDTVTTTSYTFSGLFPDSTYYVAIRPIIGGKAGYRSLAITRRPADGSCAGSISDNDLMLNAVLINSGRQQTSTAITSSQPVLVEVRNLDDAGSSSFTIHYSINGSAWQSQPVPVPVSAGGVISFATNALNLSGDPGTYVIQVAVENTSGTDPVHSNDTLTKTIRQLPNPPVNLNTGFADGFEAPFNIITQRDSVGVLPNDYWDYSNSSDSGRLRNRTGVDITIAGTRSLSMDALYSLPALQNYLTGTFNLSAYDTATTEARVEFDYKLHGKPKEQQGNEVWVRGSDTQPWLSIYGMDTMAVPGTVVNTGSLSITHALHNAGQQFTSSFAVRIGQRDTSCIAANDYGNGLTLDNFRLYSVKNDVQLLAINTPQFSNCALSASEPLIITVYNSDNLPQQDVRLFYRLDGGAIMQDTIGTIAAKDTVIHTFDQFLNLSAIGYHTLDVWLSATGDTYLPNDSIINYHFRNQPLISSFPYLENFEGGDGSWYAEGISNSWQYGAPASAKIKNAASGSKAWKTNLAGSYNDNETSYLISPCLDISGLSAPMLSFSGAMDIENCGDQLCDAAWVEWSADGILWTRLGAHDQGTNWYGDRDLWNTQDDTRWKVSSIPLLQLAGTIRIRFVLRSDAGADREGVAIDDIHVYDLAHPVYTGTNANASTAAQAGAWNDALSGNDIFASVFGSPSSINASVYKHNSAVHPLSKLYLLPRSFVLAGGTRDSINARLYVTDEDVMQMLQDNSCSDCGRPSDVYRLGMLQYRDASGGEDGSLLNNAVPGYSFSPYSNVQWVPYDKGYYAEADVRQPSEVWFSTGIPDKGYTGISIYPNPITDKTLNIIWTAAPGTSMNLLMTDATGRMVCKQSLAATDWDNKTTISIPQLAAGIYILRYKIGGDKKEIKLSVY